jgi:S-formylglutathione hydrolase FrmB
VSTFAAHHSGAAPIVVMPDINGTRHGDTECVSTARGNVERYLATDVPDYVLTHFPAAAHSTQWAIGGVSEGGMCSLLLALRHAQRFPTFVDLSGLTRPTLGRTDDPSRTVTDLFSGSWTAYQQHDPLWLLRRHHYSTLAGWLAVGATDTRARDAQRRVATAAARAGIAITQRIEPGGHGWHDWDAAMAQCLPWLWSRLTRS